MPVYYTYLSRQVLNIRKNRGNTSLKREGGRKNTGMLHGRRRQFSAFLSFSLIEHLSLFTMS